MEYKEQFTAFIDLLGFSEASRELDEAARRAVHTLLLSLANMRSNFAVATEPAEEGSTRYWVTPTISTFSDHIVISYDLEALRTTAGNDGNILPFLIFPQFEKLITVIAARALRLGFLLRGAATVGKIHHTSNVIFGEGLVEAVQLEPTAVYPRIILSAATLRMLGSDRTRTYAKRDNDGLYHIDYVSGMLFSAAPPGDEWNANLRKWFDEVVTVVQKALDTHERAGSLNKLAKWTWLASRFVAALEAIHPDGMNALGISLTDIPWRDRVR
jgi:hypothetical protein